ncbi:MULTISPECIES: universal stress protein [unclassified Nocardioides]|uniref:universal stress protein n=1 Tax=unclassified Nocardioides TaxID=2615069 RepID=UPI0018863951|nr:MULTISPECIES: universal stress protein [unclassified Nocardioides]
MKIVVVGVDGSETASAAAHRAAEIAARFDARLHIVCAHRVEGDETRHRINDNERALAVVAEERARLLSVVEDISTEAVPGKPADVILGEAERLDADLVVVGNKRLQSPLRGLGSIAGAVAHHAACDLFIVHTH